jgi:hypothetical protein
VDSHFTVVGSDALSVAATPRADADDAERAEPGSRGVAARGGCGARRPMGLPSRSAAPPRASAATTRQCIRFVATSRMGHCNRARRRRKYKKCRAAAWVAQPLGRRIHGNQERHVNPDWARSIITDLPTALTFDDVLLVPRLSKVIPSQVDVTSRFTRNIQLNVPIASAAMDTVTESALAIAMAQHGGIGVIHKNLSIEEQASEVDRVKRSESGMIVNPITLSPEHRIHEALELMKNAGSRRADYQVERRKAGSSASW